MFVVVVVLIIVVVTDGFIIILRGRLKSLLLSVEAVVCFLAQCGEMSSGIRGTGELGSGKCQG